jgi:hypothetical protein
MLASSSGDSCFSSSRLMARSHRVAPLSSPHVVACCCCRAEWIHSRAVHCADRVVSSCQLVAADEDLLRWVWVWSCGGRARVSTSSVSSDAMRWDGMGWRGAQEDAMRCRRTSESTRQRLNRTEGDTPVRHKRSEAMRVCTLRRRDDESGAWAMQRHVCCCMPPSVRPPHRRPRATCVTAIEQCPHSCVVLICVRT